MQRLQTLCIWMEIPPINEEHARRFGRILAGLVFYAVAAWIAISAGIATAGLGIYLLTNLFG
jgi:hypothetical protein